MQSAKKLTAVVGVDYSVPDSRDSVYDTRRPHWIGGRLVDGADRPKTRTIAVLPRFAMWRRSDHVRAAHTHRAEAAALRAVAADIQAAARTVPGPFGTVTIDEVSSMVTKDLRNGATMAEYAAAQHDRASRSKLARRQA